LIAVDTSVVVAAFASWHEGHDGARAAIIERPRLPVHVALEAYSVLTRLPPPHRAPAGIALGFLEARFPEVWLALPAAEHTGLLKEASQKGIVGGALYDALVAATARYAGATLLSRDRRATRAYEALGVEFRMLE
jgi:predicted nucleic acid-binding protein